ncbi:hypothetical protein BKA70DRAFT_124242 [Coprinopsis sp. MPI-PUGE-AT-0042]|nr:hypothetical protein BKA70DRAFT_124242 [Coprinopsis sp. MPI-PUGE-AT-0042]
MSSYPTPPGSSVMSSVSSFATNSATESNQQVVRDPDYFLEVVVFQVENVLFSVPRHHFAESEGIFGTLFTLPQGDPSNEKAEGTCAEHPIVLSQDRAEDFRALMKILYPKEIPVTYEMITLAEWTSILRLSTKYGFDSIRNFAIERMSPLLGNDPLARLVLGKAQSIRSWFKASCVSFINRHDGPTPEEASKMGLDTAIKIYQTREQMLRSRSVFDTAGAVERIFKAELGPLPEGISFGSSPIGGTP